MTDQLPAPSLWRDPAFQRFWLGEAISLVGSITRIRDVADAPVLRDARQEAAQAARLLP